MDDLANTLKSQSGRGWSYDPEATYVLAPSLAVSADSTTDSPELGFDTPSSVSRTLGGEKSSLITSPECRSTAMSVRLAQTGSNGIGFSEDEKTAHTLDSTGGAAVLIAQGLAENQRGELLLTDVAHQLTSGGGKPGQGYSAVAFLARTSPSLADVQGLQENAPASSTSSPESLSLFDPDGFSSRTYPVSSLARAVGTSEQSLERWPTSGTAWLGGFSTHATSECRSDEDGCSSSEPSLTEILEEPQNVPAKYSLSARAASGILRRAQKRGRTLPSHLSAALEAVARTTTTDKGAA